MLVCNVSMRPGRLGISADLVEVVSATDATATGNVIFAALVDDPASVRDRVDAYSGSIMLEAASADTAVDGGLTYSAGIVEAMTTLDSISATITAAPTAVLATYDGTATVVTVTNGGLTATHNATTVPAGVRSTQLKTSGKYYFEVTLSPTHSSMDFAGILLSTATVSNPSSGINVTGCYPNQTGDVYSNNGYAGAVSALFLVGDSISVAIDLDNRKAWFRRISAAGAAGNWNTAMGGTQNPATNQGGVTIASGSWSPAVGFLGTGAVAGDNFIANFGQSAFKAAAPAGFGNWSV